MAERGGFCDDLCREMGRSSDLMGDLGEMLVLLF
jgi:hypothetical protein